MTLRRKLFLKIAAQLLGVVVIGGIGIVGLTNLRAALMQTTDQFGSIRVAHRAGHNLVLARTFVQREPVDIMAARAQFAIAWQVLESHRQSNTVAKSADDEPTLRALRGILIRASQESDPVRLGAYATSGIAAVQQITESIQADVRQRQETAIALNERAVTTLAVVGGVIVLGSILLGVSQIRSIVQPLAALHRGITRLGRCDRQVAVDRVGDREFREVAACFNEMAQEILHMKESLEERVKERTAQLVRSERLARLGELAAGFAHEINNPLAIMCSHAELALQHWDKNLPEHNAAQTAREMAGALAVVIDEVDRSQQVVARLVSLGNHAPSASEVLSVGEITQAAIELLSPLAQQAGCRLEYKSQGMPERAQIVGDENELLQLLINLLLNAIAATEHEGGVVCVTSQAGRDSVTVRIADDGRGIDPQKIASIFDPFVSSTGSTGLGLSVCHAIAVRHGAQLDAASDGPGAGSVFTLEIPRHSKETAA